MERLDMATEIRIPKIGMSATTMTLSEWMFETGDAVEAGDIIYTVETDKTTVEVETPVAGKITVIGTEDTVYPVGELVATVE